MSCFICYRHVESDHAARLAEWLRRRLGVRAVFLAESNIAGGTKYPPVLYRAVSHADDVLVIVGKEWLKDEWLARLSDPNDWVRRELLRAQETARHMILVLLDHE